jgi:hypothetical protein
MWALPEQPTLEGRSAGSTGDARDREQCTSLSERHANTERRQALRIRTGGNGSPDE